MNNNIEMPETMHSLSRMPHTMFKLISHLRKITFSRVIWQNLGGRSFEQELNEKAIKNSWSILHKHNIACVHSY